uniref:Conserved plasma membrane protein n=1 Tax=Panagrellus redivivus TaxID=6233 RepID=A0A7E4W2N8_PANRE
MSEYDNMIPITDEDYYSYLGLNARLKTMAEDLTVSTDDWISAMEGLPETVRGPADTASNIMEKLPGPWLYWLIVAIIIVIFIIINGLLQFWLSARIRKIKKVIKELRGGPMKKAQNKAVAQQGLSNRVPANGKEEERRPGSAISREFMPKKKQNVINQWKRSDETESSNSSNEAKSVQTPFGYVPFKNAPVPIYGNRANPNGIPTTISETSSDMTGPMTANRAIYAQHAYQASPQLPRPDSVLTATDINSRPGSELGLFRLPSRYQSYTTLPRPEHVQLDVNQLQHGMAQPIYGASGIPKASVNTIDRNSIYGTAMHPEKRSLSQLSGSKSLHTVHTDTYMPRVGSKAAFGSQYGLPYEDESASGLKSVVSWNMLSTLYSLQVLVGILVLFTGGGRVFFQSGYALGYEMAYGVSILTNGFVGVLAICQHGYSLVIFTNLLALLNTIFSTLPIYIGSRPFLDVITQVRVIMLTAEKPVPDSNIYELDLVLVVVAAFGFLVSASIVVLFCRMIGKAIQHLEAVRLTNALNKSIKDIRDMTIAA